MPVYAAPSLVAPDPICSRICLEPPAVESGVQFVLGSPVWRNIREAVTSTARQET